MEKEKCLKNLNSYRIPLNLNSKKKLLIFILNPSGGRNKKNITYQTVFLCNYFQLRHRKQLKIVIIIILAQYFAQAIASF